MPNSPTYGEHPAYVLEAAAALIARRQRFVLVTSLAIKGGAAREVGSLSLVDDAGTMIGFLSNGCIDRDIRHHALSAFSENTKKLIRYGDGSPYHDLKLPCGGTLDVLIDPNPDLDSLLEAAQSLTDRKPATLEFSTESAGDATQAVSRFTYLPRIRLSLAGRGAIFRSMAQVGHATGFEIHLMSPDTEDLAAIGHLAADPPLHLTSPEKPVDMTMLDRHSAFLTLFHDHEWEPQLLKVALASPVGFIGSLGSRRTHELRCEALRQLGVKADAIARLRGPLGLVGPLRNASFISVSALAEVIAEFPTQVVQDAGARTIAQRSFFG